MTKTKNKLNNAARHAFLGSIMKKSGNYLPLTNREKSMSKWFIKFQCMMTIVIISWIMPIQAITSHFDDYKALEVKVSVQEVFIPEAQAQEEIQLFELVDEFTGTVYAYNSFESQTDGDPLIGAFGSVEGMENKIVANNCYLPGTIVEIEGKKYEVFDRMNKRYGCDVFDIYMGMDHEAAINFGKKITNVKILRFNK